MFTSSFFLIYLLIVVLIFFSIRREWRISVLAVASLIFCFHLDIYAGIVLVILTLFSFAGGHWMEWLKKREKKKYTGIIVKFFVLFDISLLFIYKFAVYFLERFQYAEEVSPVLMEYLMIPLGLSFYTFQSVSYLVDVYKDTYNAKENLMEFLLYMSFFPKFLSGPIERAKDFMGQLKEIKEINFWQSGRLSIAFTYILYGYFMKIVIADRVAMIVNRIFEYPQGYDTIWLIVGIVFYTIQIYADFAGYSYIAVGVAKIFGIKIQINFKNPYFSYSISEFWRKWHISLSSWLRDYLYIPLGGNRKGKVRKNLNTMIVFIVCGIWHGTGISFFIWGILHGLYSIADNLILNNVKNPYLKRSITIVEIAAAWVFFRATSASAAINYFKQIVVQGVSFERIINNFYLLELNGIEMSVIVVSIFIMILADKWANNYKTIFPEILQKKSQLIRYCIFYILLIFVIVFGIYGTGYDPGNFIYMQF